MEEILKAYGLETVILEVITNGLINSTWKVITPENNYILQKINDKVFPHPQDLAYNISLMSAYLQKAHPDYLFIKPVASITGDDVIFCEGRGWFRLFHFIEGSHTINVVQKPEQAYEAAAQFGKFTLMLSGFNARELKLTLPKFHDIGLRYQQFLNAVATADKERQSAAQNLIDELVQHRNIVDQYNAFASHAQFKLRVTHHDTKISNVLFDANGKGLCVIDLDTVMPGYFFSDVGDMMRTYLPAVSEEEKDFSTIEVRDAYYKAIVEGYSSQMKDQLTKEEKSCFFFAGTFTIYMQALRFLTDYLKNDIYYGAKYEHHNLRRAGNQTVLLQSLMARKTDLINFHV